MMLFSFLKTITSRVMGSKPIEFCSSRGVDREERAVTFRGKKTKSSFYGGMSVKV